MLSHDKALSKQILLYHRIPTPRFTVCERGRSIRPPRQMEYPMFVKSTVEDASFGLSEDSLVQDEVGLRERVRYCHDEIGTDALVEEYIEGRELYVGVMGNYRLRVLPVWELLFTKLPNGRPNIATAKVKWDSKVQKRLGVKTEAAKDLPVGVTEHVTRLCKRIYRALCMSGYARMDLRLGLDGRVYVLEANANPNLSYGEDFAESAHLDGLRYEDLIQRILHLGFRYRPAWSG
jgi:D-alanine-D-alanine ligase